MVAGSNPVGPTIIIILTRSLGIGVRKALLNVI